ncbi:hypothetical protein C8N46_101701 [Kordia periserrulae]|uniref:YD repeat-containing protein n=1 Tax=Kordia periserrulae TaxID=701523 RepID=A0A2T6C6Y9_9FLAO|nr:hypothetical protein [Kordia periserrulae]PTX64091.1 hypothetical protein C8N46_101701 [Kordia periserrulae]
MKQILIISAIVIISLTHTFAQEGNPPSGQSTLGTFDNNCSSFYPLPGEKYIVSCWVKESNSTTKKTYTNGVMEINFYNGPDINGVTSLVPALPTITMYPSGKIIEGWQRIVGIVTIPQADGEEVAETPRTIGINLACLQQGTSCYFDDVRIFPFNGSMKSFVYDKDTQRLMAELDENNYATYYEYDKEGGLVRVKKETEKGVYTIQETRSKSKKQ